MTLSHFHIALHNWYHSQGRKALPWRNTDDPYAIWLSEVMLQQTQVKTVLERFYFPFLNRFPTLTSLAEAERQEVLKHWEGLGYYTRAANLHKAAQQAAPHMPKTVEGLLALPGIGQNTAHAVAAFAYHQPVAILEANVKRIIYRIFALTEAKDAVLWEHAQSLLDHEHPFDYNQAMMDIGALICTKTTPKCHECPAAVICKGKENPMAYPAKKAKKITPIRQKTIIVLCAGERYYLAPRTSRFLHGLYGFNEYDRGYPTTNLTYLGHVEQTYSHFHLDAEVYLQQEKQSFGEGWYTLKEITTLPLSRADSKVARLLEMHAAIPTKCV